MDSPKTVTASFGLIPDARIGTTPYATLSSAYSDITEGGEILARAMTFNENLNLNRGVTFTLRGGYADDYGSVTGYTVLNGVLTIGSGRLTLERLVVK